MRIEIAGRNFTHFSKYEINLVFNAIASSFSFTAQYDFIDKLIDYPVCYIYNDDEVLLIKGTVLPPTLKSSSVQMPVTVQGYSSSGVLEDCQIPVSLYPLQYDGMSLSDITTRILSAFLFDFKYSNIVKDDLFKNYEKVEAKPAQTIKEFLNKLADERNIILSNLPDGSLYYTRLDTSNISIKDSFQIGKHGIKSMTLQIDGQKLHNPIWVIGQADSEESGDSNEAIITNPYVSYFRPKVVVSQVGDEFDAEKVARNELGKELGKIRLIFETTKFNFPGNLISVVNSDIKINTPTEFFIESVKIKGTSEDTDVYTYICVLKDVYTNNDVKNILK